ncbi:MAG: M13 family metallopeptidase [Pseudomonadota bacterium]
MKKILIGSFAAALAACAAQSPRTPAPDSVQGTTPSSGLDLAGFDREVRPQDDLFRFAGGTWLRTTEIPADRSNIGTFELLAIAAEEQVRRILEETAHAPGLVPGSDEQKIGDFYTSFMNTERLETLGAQPLADDLARIDALRTPSDVVRFIGHGQRIGVNHPLVYFVAQDARDSNAYLPGIFQSGLTLPDRDYYLKADRKYQGLRAGLKEYARDLLTLAGLPQAEEAAEAILALETKIAEAHWTRVQNRDPVATYNKMSLAEASKLAPGFDWAAFLEGAGAPATDLDISQPSYVKALGELVQTVPVEQWRHYFRFRVLDAYAPYLSAAFVDRHFQFRERALRGIEEPRPRWKRAVATLDRLMGEAVGRLYVERHFPPEAKERMNAIVANILRAFDSSIDELDWMTPATKAEAKKKLASFTVKIGYPEKWRDYGKLEISPTDLVGNVMRATAFEHERGIARIGRPVDRSEWFMSPQTVNAYYNPPMNEIVFPAAILQPPFFDVNADDAVNYGAIGAVIGHEISHGFDDSGRRFDGAGNLRDWWTAEDDARFREKAAKLVAQYSGYTVLDGQPVNGELTLGENIGDLSGLAVAYKAWQLSLGGAPSPVIDGFTGPQRFFLGWAQIWRRKYRDDELRMRLLTDPHSPAEFRANGVVTNMAEFHEAFGLEPGDRLYRAPEERVKIW